MQATFSIERLKAVKLIPQFRNPAKFPITRDKRTDMMDKLRREAVRVLDRGRDVGGIRGRQTQSPRFDDIGWVESYVKMRLAYLPKRQTQMKLVNKARHLVRQDDADTVWTGIIYMESAHNLYPAVVLISELDDAILRYWWMKGLTD